MRKADELAQRGSCLDKAQDDEMLFILLGRDPSAPVAIRAWIADRIATGQNRPDDQQMIDASRCLMTMELERASLRESIKRS